MSPSIGKLVDRSSLELDASDDDLLASQQLFIESQTPRPKPIPIVNSSVVKSTNLLNAVRRQNITATAPPPSTSLSLNGSQNVGIHSSAGGGMASRTGNRKLSKLKRPNILSGNLSKIRREGAGKRADIYALPASPEKEDEVILPQAVNKSHIRVLNKGKKIKSTSAQLELASALASPDVEIPDLSAIDLRPRELMPSELASSEAGSDGHAVDPPSISAPSSPPLLSFGLLAVPQLPSALQHGHDSLEQLLSNGHPRCTGKNLTKRAGTIGQQCHRKGTIKTEAGWRCHTHEAQQDPSVPQMNQNAQSREEADRYESGRLTDKAADVTEKDGKMTPGIRETNTQQKKPPKRKADVSKLVFEKALKSPRLHKVKSAVRKEDEISASSGRDRSHIRRSKQQIAISSRKPSNEVVAVQATRAAKSEAEEEEEEEDEEDEEEEDENEDPPAEMADMKVEENASTETGHQDELSIHETDLEPTEEKRTKNRKGTFTGHLRSTRATADPELEATKSSTAQATRTRPTRLKPNKRGPATLFKPSRGAKTVEGAPDEDGVLEEEAEHMLAQEDAEDGIVENAEDDNQMETNSNSQGDAEREVEESEDDEEFQHSEDDDYDQITELDRVFKYLDCEEREGACQTDEGIGLYKACYEACKLITEHDLSLQEISNASDRIRHMLSAIRNEKVDDVKAFKVDAYCYLFRSLTRFLKVVHDGVWSDAETPGRLPAIRALFPLVRDILSFKDTLGSWKVQIPQRYKGDRTIRQVDERLIVPLRKVNDSYRAEFSELRWAEKNRQRREELYALRRQKEENRKKEEEVQRIKKANARTWQYLEIARLECEPDLQRRQELVPLKPDKYGERDSNGVAFDRVPVFAPRNTPPPLVSSIKLREWSDEESIALAEALQRFAGFPPYLVFEKIFQTCCRPGGVLRLFNATDIVTRAAYRREEYMKLYEMHGWEVDKWIVQIPVLI